MDVNIHKIVLPNDCSIVSVLSYNDYKASFKLSSMSEGKWGTILFKLKIDDFSTVQ